MGGFTVELNIDQALKAFDLTGAECRQAVPRALNRTATTALARAARAIREVGYNVNVGRIKKNIRVDRATAEKPNIRLIASGKPIPLIAYKPTGGGTPSRRRPITVRVLGKSTTFTHAFYVTLRSGHKGIFSRQTKGSISKRLPISELFGPSITDAFENERVQSIVTAAIRERFEIELRSQVDLVVSKR